MTTRIIAGIAIGAGVGALMGYFGQCSSGTCPLTANPYRGAIYGAVMGALFSITSVGPARQDGGTEEGVSKVGAGREASAKEVENADI